MFVRKKAPKKQEETFYDELIDDVIEVCKLYETIFPSMIQDYFEVGYARACRIFDQLEELGIICKREYIPSEYGQLLAGKIDKDKIRELKLN